ncbi:MAG: TonB family protein [Acidobacteriota bacterium]
MKLQSSQTIRSTIAVLLLPLFLCSAYAVQDKTADAKATRTPEQIEADNLNGQVIQLFKEKKFKEAMAPAKRCVELREKSLGAEHESTAVALNNLASVYSELDKHGDAAETRERLLKVQEKLYGPSSAKLCDNLSKLGWERALNGNNKESEEAFKRNLQIRETAYGTEGKELLPALNDLAMSTQRAGKYVPSIGYFDRMIAVNEKLLGKNHTDVAELLAKTAIILRQANKKAEAEDYETRARAIYTAQPTDNRKPPEMSGGVLQGLAIFRPQPGYPNSAKQGRIQGAVQVHVYIDEIGIVTEAKAISGPAELRKVSEEAAKQWRFKPTILGGRVLKVHGVLTFNFTLQ